MSVRLRAVVVLFLFVLSIPVGAIAAEITGSDPANIQKQYSGNWVRSDVIEASLGFAGSVREFSGGGGMQVPETIEIEIDETLDGDTVETTRPLFRMFQQVRKIQHQLIATGRFRFGNLKRTICVVARYNDATYLWHGARFIGFMDTRISFVPGAKRGHDLLFLEWFPEQDKGVPVVASYKRSKE